MKKDQHPEIISVPPQLERVACSGEGGVLGHPKVYYTFHGQDEVVCGYCDRLFSKKKHTGAKPYKEAV